MRDETAKFKADLTMNYFVAEIQHLNEVIKSQQNQECDIIMTPAQLHLNYVAVKQGLTLYLDNS